MPAGAAILSGPSLRRPRDGSGPCSGRETRGQRLGRLRTSAFHVALIEEIGQYIGAEAKAAFDRAFSLNTAEELRQLAALARLTDFRVRFTHRTMRHAAPAE